MTDTFESLFQEEGLSDEERAALEALRNTTYAQLRTTFQKLATQRGDLIAINFPSDISQEQMYMVVEQGQRLVKAMGIHVVILTDGIRMEHFDEDKMKQAGWIRDPSFKPTTRKYSS